MQVGKIDSIKLKSTIITTEVTGSLKLKKSKKLKTRKSHIDLQYRTNQNLYSINIINLDVPERNDAAPRRASTPGSIQSHSLLSSGIWKKSLINCPIKRPYSAPIALKLNLYFKINI